MASVRSGHRDALSSLKLVADLTICSRHIVPAIVSPAEPEPIISQSEFSPTGLADEG